jgi:hypothetical protein
MEVDISKSHIVTLAKDGPQVLATFTPGQEINGEMETWFEEHAELDLAFTIVIYVDQNGEISAYSTG